MNESSMILGNFGQFLCGLSEVAERFEFSKIFKQKLLIKIVIVSAIDNFGF